jgi:glutamine synthetase
MSGRVPKIVKRESDIQNWYGDRPELAEKLRVALKHLPSIGIRGVIKGDLMFTDSMLDAYIELKMQEVTRFRMATHPVEFDMYYSL